MAVSLIEKWLVAVSWTIVLEGAIKTVEIELREGKKDRDLRDQKQL